MFGEIGRTELPVSKYHLVVGGHELMGMGGQSDGHCAGRQRGYAQDDLD